MAQVAYPGFGDELGNPSDDYFSSMLYGDGQQGSYERSFSASSSPTRSTDASLSPTNDLEDSRGSFSPSRSQYQYAPQDGTRGVDPRTAQMAQQMYARGVPSLPKRPKYADPAMPASPSQAHPSYALPQQNAQSLRSRFGYLDNGQLYVTPAAAAGARSTPPPYPVSQYAYAPMDGAFSMMPNIEDFEAQRMEHPYIGGDSTDAGAPNQVMAAAAFTPMNAQQVQQQIMQQQHHQRQPQQYQFHNHSQPAQPKSQQHQQVPVAAAPASSSSSRSKAKRSRPDSDEDDDDAYVASSSSGRSGRGGHRRNASMSDLGDELSQPIQVGDLRLTADELAAMTPQDLDDYLKRFNLTTEQEKFVKRQRRLIKNRESAQMSRMKKKKYVEELEDRVAALTEKADKLTSDLLSLRRENERLQQELESVRGSPSTSSSTPVSADGDTIMKDTEAPSPFPSLRKGKAAVQDTKMTNIYLLVILFAFGLFIGSPNPQQSSIFLQGRDFLTFTRLSFTDPALLRKLQTIEMADVAAIAANATTDGAPPLQGTGLVLQCRPNKITGSEKALLTAAQAQALTESASRVVSVSVALTLGDDVVAASDANGNAVAADIDRVEVGCDLVQSSLYVK